jgi:DNA-binding CsgD family transcriptional regulator
VKNSKAIAYLRQLCCLGLSKELVVSEFLRAVRSVIPSDNNVCTMLKPPFQIDHHIMGFDVSELANLPIEIMATIFTPECEVRSAAWFSQHPVLTDTGLWDKAYYSSDAYNLVWRPLDQHHMLWASVLQYGKPVALLGLFRPKQQQPFNSDEQVLLPRLMPYVAHALGMASKEAVLYDEKGTSGLVIMNSLGNMLYQSPEAKRLLFLADCPVINVFEGINTIGGHSTVNLLSILKQICLNLDGIFQGKTTAPPVWSLTNGHGRFVFRAYGLEQQNHEPGGLVGINIELQEPKILKIVRALQDFPLSPIQKEVAILLAQGLSNEKIGERLHIKLTTVKDHVRKIFVKLDIDHREELLPKLLAMQKQNLIQLRNF